MKNLLLCLMISVLAGCATSRDAATFATAPMPEVKPDKAILYIFRHYAEPTAFASYLEIDKQEVASLNQEGFTWVYVEPGTHNFEFGWPFFASMPGVNFQHTLQAGETYAFEMQGSSSYSGNQFNTRSAIQPIKIEEAIARMNICCRYVAPVKPAK